MLLTGSLPYYSQHTVSNIYRSLFAAMKGVVACHGKMTTQSYDLVAYRMLEAKDNANADYHHSQTDCHTCCGDIEGRLADLLLVAAVCVYSSCYV